MTNTSSQKKESLLRALAVAGLVAIIIIIAWLSIRIVQVAPNAFSSLASLAEGINQYEEEMEEDLSDSPLTPLASLEELASGQSVGINIADVEQIGDYTFSYECINGVTIIALNEEGGRELSCNTVYNIDNPNLDLRIESTANTDLEIPYVVTFSRPSDEEPYRTGSGTLTVLATVDTEPVGEVAGENTSEDDSSDVDPTPTPEPVTTVEYVYQIPTSNPNGFVELTTSYTGVGTDDGLTTTLPRDETGVFFFEVKNIGTKTSDDWRFSVTLPNGGEFNSERQAPLKPNERATLALAVETTDESGFTFEVTVETDEDRLRTNNSFSQRVNFTR